MKKESKRNVKIGNHSFQVTDAAPEVYRITLFYAGGIPKEEFYRGFRDEDEVNRFLIEIADIRLCIGCSYRYSFTVIFDGGHEDEE